MCAGVEDLVREKINGVKNTTNSTRLERKSQTVKERERKKDREKVLSVP